MTGDVSSKKNIHNFDNKVLNSYIKTEKNVSQNNYLAFCGLGNNLKFFRTLKYADFNIVSTKEFFDHHIYSKIEIEQLIQSANSQNLKLITTEKDIVKIPKKYHSFINYIKMNVELDKNDLKILKLFFKEKLNA